MARVLVGDPHFSLEAVRDLLDGVADAEAAEAPWRGDDVVGLLAGPDYPVSRDDLSSLPALSIVSTPSVGFDHIDLEAAVARRIWVTNVPDYCVDEMADSTLALLLALRRGIVALDRTVREGRWDYTAAGPLSPLGSMRLGVIGFGRVGRAVAARARALGVAVAATDALVPDADIAAAGVRPAELSELLGSCDAFSLHAPLTSETERMLGERELERMPRGAILVNTARARLVDVTALVRALESGRLSGAALDVLPVEPPTSAAPPPEHPRLVVTPHAAWYSDEAERDVYRRAVLSVRTLLEGGVPDGAVVRPAARA
jgi:D-3-phosphoglycerate dehydrogenase